MKAETTATESKADQLRINRLSSFGLHQEWEAVGGVLTAAIPRQARYARQVNCMYYVHIWGPGWHGELY